MNFNRVFHYKPSILAAHPYFWKQPFHCIQQTIKHTHSLVEPRWKVPLTFPRSALHNPWQMKSLKMHFMSLGYIVISKESDLFRFILCMFPCITTNDLWRRFSWSFFYPHPFSTMPPSPVSPQESNAERVEASPVNPMVSWPFCFF